MPYYPLEPSPEVIASRHHSMIGLPVHWVRSVTRRINVPNAEYYGQVAECVPAFVFKVLDADTKTLLLVTPMYGEGWTTEATYSDEHRPGTWHYAEIWDAVAHKHEYGDE